MSNTALRLHDQAMSLADEAALARSASDLELADQLTREAFNKEAAAAAALEHDLNAEPWRATLHRSAAVLAVECNEFRAAEKLVGRALAGEPPAEIAEELRELWDDIRFRLHLESRKIVLAPDKLHLMIKGPATANGLASENAVRDRIESLGRLVFRTAERKRGKPYRDRGRITRAMRREFQLFLSKPEPPGYSVSMALGSQSGQLSLPGSSALDFGPEVLDELMDCLELFDRSDVPLLEERIPDQAYYRNFVSLASKIAPDGEEVMNVTLMVTRAQEQRIVALENPLPHPLNESPLVKAGKITIHGVPRFTDSDSEQEGKLQIEDQLGQVVAVVRIPEGQLSDIVRPMLDQEIEITAYRENNEWVLETIETAEASLTLKKPTASSERSQPRQKDLRRPRQGLGP